MSWDNFGGRRQPATCELRIKREVLSLCLRYALLALVLILDAGGLLKGPMRLSVRRQCRIGVKAVKLYLSYVETTRGRDMAEKFVEGEVSYLLGSRCFPGGFRGVSLELQAMLRNGIESGETQGSPRVTRWALDGDEEIMERFARLQLTAGHGYARRRRCPACETDLSGHREDALGWRSAITLSRQYAWILLELILVEAGLMAGFLMLEAIVCRLMGRRPVLLASRICDTSREAIVDCGARAATVLGEQDAAHWLPLEVCRFFPERLSSTNWSYLKNLREAFDADGHVPGDDDIPF